MTAALIGVPMTRPVRPSRSTGRRRRRPLEANHRSTPGVRIDLGGGMGRVTVRPGWQSRERVNSDRVVRPVMFGCDEAQAWLPVSLVVDPQQTRV